MKSENILKKGRIITDNCGSIIITELEGQDIDLHANKGIINLDSNEKINMKSKTIEVNGDSVVKFFSSGLLELIGQNTLNFWGGLIDCADGATTGLPSKGESLLEDQQRGGGLDG